MKRVIVISLSILFYLQRKFSKIFFTGGDDSSEEAETTQNKDKQKEKTKDVESARVVYSLVWNFLSTADIEFVQILFVLYS